jgi:hypothetical protein
MFLCWVAFNAVIYLFCKGFEEKSSISGIFFVDKKC